MNLQTPYYVIHEKKLDDNYQKLNSALQNNWNNYIIGYSYKTNALPWVISHFDKLGAYAEVVSEDEYNLAKTIGVKNSNIIYNGPIKTKETFLDALKNGAYVNIDSQREISWLEDLEDGSYNIGIRVNFDIEKMCPGQSQCGDEGGRFGFCLENGEFETAITKIKQTGKSLKGLHLHTSSKSRGLDIYRAIAETACLIVEKYQLSFKYIDVGGGFYGGLSSKPQFDEYISLMGSILSKCFDVSKTKLIIEPGMAVIGAPISYVSTVIDVKDTEFNRFVITDGTRTSIDPLMTKSSYFHMYRRNDKKATVKKQVICGYTCMEHDRLFEAEDEPELVVGDKIIYDKVGAYTMCLTPLFIKYFPDVYVEKNGQMMKVRDAWTPREYIQCCAVEERL